MPGMMTQASMPAVNKTELDAVFYEEFEAERVIGEAYAEDERIFNQKSTQNGAYITAQYSSGGFWQQTNENVEVIDAPSTLGPTVNFVVKKWTQGLPISYEMYQDGMFDVVGRSVREMAEEGRVTKQKNAFGVYADLTGTVYTNPQGTPLLSTVLPLINTNGQTTSNKITGKLSPSSLRQALNIARKQKDHNGVPRGFMPQVLLVDSSNWERAMQVTEGVYEAGSANFTLNYSKKYNLFVAATPFVGTASGLTGSSDDAWFLIGRDPGVLRVLRQDIQTFLQTPQTRSNLSYYYKGLFREEYGIIDSLKVVGSDGSTGAYVS